jgi:uncharacterized protein
MDETPPVFTPLERGQLWLMRIRAGIGALLVLAAAGALETAFAAELRLPRGILVLPLLLPLAWAAFVAPSRRYRAWGYAMDGEELQVRRGIWTQVHTVVPLDRIQHIDVAQGALERSLGLWRLIVHTAGTLHSEVVLPGLARETAERMRDEIRARIRAESE